ncbi:flagellar export protein FliJ [Aquibacillus saliphilus]|uniref:flagellar export protein FliJ n=1 Tax=Aquibacillus saliphilus TaxID=1909422 RepID=UPI001CF0C9B7|nr:flagellar export protein FliJ [Aquibacillus saliphilus]
MVEPDTFQKILIVREKEKKQVQKDYKIAVDSFEDIASRLYTMLKKKEEAENSYRQLLGNSGQITSLTTHYSFLEKIKLNIRQLETSVNKARTNMENTQSKLTAAHIEVKRFEKLIEQKRWKQLEKEKKEDTMLMDELSVRQFSYNRDR